MRGAKCTYCGKEINAFELATCDINGKKRYCHTDCHMKRIMDRTMARHDAGKRIAMGELG